MLCDVQRVGLESIAYFVFQVEKWVKEKLEEYYYRYYDKEACCSLRNLSFRHWSSLSFVADILFKTLDHVLVAEGTKPDTTWVQCNKCLKWRQLPPGTASGTTLHHVSPLS
jgi:hypothetical protein